MTKSKSTNNSVEETKAIEETEVITEEKSNGVEIEYSEESEEEKQPKESKEKDSKKGNKLDSIQFVDDAILHITNAMSRSVLSGHLKESKKLQNSNLPAILKKTVLEFYQAIGKEDLFNKTSFFSAIVMGGKFMKLKTPTVVKFEDKPVIDLDGNRIDISGLWASPKYKIVSILGDKASFFTLSDKTNEESQLSELKLGLSTVKLDTPISEYKFNTSMKLALTLIADYVYKPNDLEDGKYKILSFKKNTNSIEAMIDIGVKKVKFFLKAYQVDQIKEAESTNGNAYLVRKGTKGNGYPNVFIDGFEPIMSLKSLFVEAYQEVKEEKLKLPEEGKTIVFDEPVSYNVLKTSKVTGKYPGISALVSRRGKEYNVRLNSYLQSCVSSIIDREASLEIYSITGISEGKYSVDANFKLEDDTEANEEVDLLFF